MEDEKRGREKGRGEREEVEGGDTSNKDLQSYALVGCTVSPGFNFEDFELAPQTTLAARYPQHSNLINKLTRSSS